MFYTIVVLVIGVVVEKKYSPRLSTENNTLFFHYTKSKGVRNKTKLFGF